MQISARVMFQKNPMLWLFIVLPGRYWRLAINNDSSLTTRATQVPGTLTAIRQECQYWDYFTLHYSYYRSVSRVVSVDVKTAKVWVPVSSYPGTLRKNTDTNILILTFCAKSNNWAKIIFLFVASFSLFVIFFWITFGPFLYPAKRTWVWSRRYRWFWHVVKCFDKTPM